MAKKQQFESEGKTYTVKEKKPFYKKWWFWLLALVLIGALTQMGKDKNNPTGSNNTSSDTKQAAPVKEETAEPVAEESDADYEISDIALDESGYTPAVTGIFKNTSGKEMNYVQIEFPVKDADGNKIGNAIANMNGLKDGETWKFNAMSFSTEEGQVIDLENYEVSGF